MGVFRRAAVGLSKLQGFLKEPMHAFATISPDRWREAGLQPTLDPPLVRSYLR
jgi:hypothetical protein